MEALKELGLYIASLRHIKYSWGQTDCNTFVTKWIDIRHDTNTSAEIVGKYHDIKTAVKFAKNYTPAPEYLKQQGYDITRDNPKSGDIILQRNMQYYGAYIVLTGRAYTMHNTTGLVEVDCRNIANATVWRYYG